MAGQRCLPPRTRQYHSAVLLECTLSLSMYPSIYPVQEGQEMGRMGMSGKPVSCTASPCPAEDWDLWSVWR